MDCILLMTLIGVCVLQLFLSYDIACQFGELFFDCVKFLPAVLRPISLPEVSFCVPKFHLPIHVKSCWEPFSFNFWALSLPLAMVSFVDRLNAQVLSFYSFSSL